MSRSRAVAGHHVNHSSPLTLESVCVCVTFSCASCASARSASARSLLALTRSLRASTASSPPRLPALHALDSAALTTQQPIRYKHVSTRHTSPHTGHWSFAMCTIPSLVMSSHWVLPPLSPGPSASPLGPHHCPPPSSSCMLRECVCCATFQLWCLSVPVL